MWKIYPEIPNILFHISNNLLQFGGFHYQNEKPKQSPKYVVKQQNKASMADKDWIRLTWSWVNVNCVHIRAWRIVKMQWNEFWMVWLVQPTRDFEPCSWRRWTQPLSKYGHESGRDPLSFLSTLGLFNHPVIQLITTLCEIGRNKNVPLAVLLWNENRQEWDTFCSVF